MLMQWKSTGDFLKVEGFLNKIKRGLMLIDFNKFGREGVEAP